MRGGQTWRGGRKRTLGWQDVRVPLLLGRQRLAAWGRHQHPTLSSQDRVTLRSNGHDDRVCNPRMSHWLLLAPGVHIRYLSLTLHPDTEPDMSSCSPCSPRTSNERSGLLWGGETEGYMETPQQLENACRVLRSPNSTSLVLLRVQHPSPLVCPQSIQIASGNSHFITSYELNDPSLLLPHLLTPIHQGAQPNKRSPS